MLCKELLGVKEPTSGVSSIKFREVKLHIVTLNAPLGFENMIHLLMREIGLVIAARIIVVGFGCVDWFVGYMVWARDV